VEAWERILAVMLTAPCPRQEFLPGMYAARWGRVVNVASVHGLVASPFKSAYVAAKHGLVGLTKTIALEAAARCPDVTAHAICPTYGGTRACGLDDDRRRLHDGRGLAGALTPVGSAPMGSYRYLVVGGGMTGDSACRGIRDHDRDGTIGLVGAEPHAPYARPPLSKGLWKGKPEDSIFRGTAELDVELHLGRRIVALDLAGRTATDDAGTTHEYEKLLLATGGEPRRLPDAVDDVVYFRTLDHYRRLREVAGEGARIAVIGGGFIGSELAAALASEGCATAILFPEHGIGALLFPTELSAFVSDYYRSQGVEVLPGELVASVTRQGDELRVATDSGRELAADAVVAGLGIRPSTALAEEAGLQVDDGVLVDAYGRVQGHEDVFAAGDVARFPLPALGGTRRVEHEDHANSHGHAVGANMAGADEPYDHLPFFYSDLFDLGYEAVGDVDSRLATLAEWAEPNRKGVVAYVDEALRPHGFLLWDVWGKVDAARELIRAGEPVEAETLRSLFGE